jgi:dCTP deaminase
VAMLTGPQILLEAERGNIVIEPFDRRRLNPNSYNMSLGRKLLVYLGPVKRGWSDSWRQLSHDRDSFGDPILSYSLRENDDEEGSDLFLDMKKDNPVAGVEIPETGIVLHPGTLFIGHTEEYTETRGFVPVIEGRSSVGRLGLCVHVTAGFGDVGFRGQWSLEMTVVHPLRVYAGVEICQIAYTTTLGEIVPYAGKYSGDRGPKASRLWKEFRKEGGP